MTSNPVVMLTALNTEYAAVRERLRDLRVDQERGTRFEVGNLRGTQCRVVLGLTGKGNDSAGILAERAIRRYSPVAVLFVGIAGALWDSTQLGDVVVATRVYAYHGATSEDDGLRARPRAWEVRHEITQIAAHIARADDWADDRTPDGLGRPQAHLGPIAAGDIVQNSRLSREAMWIREHYNDALAIEMEAAGVAQAGHLNGSPVAVVRGISDRADGTKTSGNDRDWQPRAAANAAAFAARLAEALITEEEQTVGDGADRTRPGSTVHNNAYAPVGIQGGYVDGSTVFMGASPGAAGAPDLAAELAAIRQLLARERSAGHLDAATCEAAEAELDGADEALPADTEPTRSKFMLALKRLRGLIGDVADLAAKVAALIKTVSGSS